MNKKLLIISLALAVMLIIAFFTSKVKYEDFILTDEQNKSSVVDFPYSAESQKDGNMHEYELNGKIYLNIFSPRSYKIIPDDKILSLAINGKDVSLAHIPENKKSDYANGFVINLSEYLHSGENIINVKFLDGGGLMGLKILQQLNGLRMIIFYTLLSVCLLFFMFAFSKKIGLPKRYLFILCLAIIIRIFYLSVTDIHTRPHDTNAHIEYIKYFADNWSLPPIDKAAGGAFFHPPLYYFSSALIYSGVFYITNGNINSVHSALQIFSLCMSIAFIFLGFKITRLIFAYFIKKDSMLLQKILPWICCWLIAMWPSGIIHSVRIGNDSMLYFLFSAAMYFWISLFLQKRNENLIPATIFTAAAILTKLNAAILLPMVLVLFILKLIYGQVSFSRRNILKGVLACLIMAASLGFALYPGIALKHDGKRSNVYVTNMGSILVVGTKLENFLWLDVKTFVNEPFTSPFYDQYGRQYFPNYLGKTALFGEWRYKGTAIHNIGVAMSVIALAMFALSIIFLYRTPMRDVKILLPLLLVSFLSLCGMTHMRYTFPVNVDFRYILPVIIPFCIYFNYGINLSLCQAKKRLAVLAIFLELLFCLLSAAFTVEIINGSHSFLH